MANSLRAGQALAFGGAVVSIVSAIAGQVERDNCDQPTTWGWGLIHSLSVMNSQIREQVCLNESLKSPSTFLFVAGLLMLVIGVALWMKSAGKGNLRITKCPFCAETILAAAQVCKHCGKDLPKRRLDDQDIQDSSRYSRQVKGEFMSINEDAPSVWSNVDQQAAIRQLDDRQLKAWKKAGEPDLSSYSKETGQNFFEWLLSIKE